jgi:hypothetical protein
MSTHHPRPNNDKPSIFFPDPNLVKQNGKVTDTNIQNRDKMIMSFQKNLLTKTNNTSTYDSNQSTITQTTLPTVSVSFQKDLDESFMRLRQCMLNEKQDIKLEKAKLLPKIRDINKLKIDLANIYQVCSINPVFTKGDHKPIPGNVFLN